MVEFSSGKSKRFPCEETDLLTRKVKACKQTIYGTNRILPKLPEVKAAWEEVTMIVSSFPGITRMAVQCRKGYNVRRQGKQKLTANTKQQVATGGGPPTATPDLTLLGEKNC